MSKRSGILGLTTKCSKSNVRCDRCDLLLVHSTWNDVSVCYSISKSPNDGFICIQCATGRIKTIKPRTTSQEVDVFIQHLKKKQSVLMQH